MKKIAIFIAAVAMVTGLSLKSQIDFNEFTTAKFYVEGHIDDPRSVNCGADSIVTVSPSLAHDFYEATERVKGITLTSDKTLLALRQKYNIKILQVEKFEGCAVYYGYSPNFGDTINLKETKINVQFVIREDFIVLGIPMIMTDW